MCNKKIIKTTKPAVLNMNCIDLVSTISEWSFVHSAWVHEIDALCGESFCWCHRLCALCKLHKICDTLRFQSQTAHCKPRWIHIHFGQYEKGDKIGRGTYAWSQVLATRGPARDACVALRCISNPPIVARDWTLCDIVGCSNRPHRS